MSEASDCHSSVMRFPEEASLAKTETKGVDLQQSIEIPKKLPLLPIRDIVVFPYMVLPLFVGREMSIKAIEVALEGNRMIFLTSQKDINVENPSPSDLYSVGTVGVIMRMLKLPDGRIKILVQGVARAKTIKFLQKIPLDPMTGTTDWGLKRTSGVVEVPQGGGIFDVYTKSEATALDGTQYQDW